MDAVEFLKTIQSVCYDIQKADSPTNNARPTKMVQFCVHQKKMLIQRIHHLL